MRGICNVCGDEFITHSKRVQYTCSYECRKKKNKIEFMDRIKRFSPRIEYIGGYLDMTTEVKFKCNICGGIFERTPSKMCDKKSEGQCPICKLKEPRICPKCGANHINKHKKGYCEECADIASNGYGLTCLHCGKDFVSKNCDKKTCSYECMLEYGKSEREKLYNPRIKQCKNCGVEFATECGKTNSMFCCEKCKRRYTNKTKRIYEKTIRIKRIIKNGNVDKGITLDRLIKRDKSMCHLCGGLVDINDYDTNNNGYVICGDYYPSIDHVVPIAKGGTHSWENVKLAHRLCNSIKSDTPNYYS